MSDFIIKPLTAEIALPATANTVGSASIVRLINVSTTVGHVITKKDANTVTLGSLTMNPSQDVFIAKNPTDTLQVDSGTDIKAVSVAFK